jgi:hypothetical protein
MMTPLPQDQELTNFFANKIRQELGTRGEEDDRCTPPSRRRSAGSSAWTKNTRRVGASRPGPERKWSNEHQGTAPFYFFSHSVVVMAGPLPARPRALG